VRTKHAEKTYVDVCGINRQYLKSFVMLR